MPSGSWKTQSSTQRPPPARVPLEPPGSADWKLRWSGAPLRVRLDVRPSAATTRHCRPSGRATASQEATSRGTSRSHSGCISCPAACARCAASPPLLGPRPARAAPPAASSDVPDSASSIAASSPPSAPGGPAPQAPPASSPISSSSSSSPANRRRALAVAAARASRCRASASRRRRAPLAHAPYLDALQLSSRERSAALRGDASSRRCAAPLMAHRVTDNHHHVRVARG